MFELYGRYTNATIFAEEIEKEAVSQIQGLCNHPAFEGAKISIMSDAHAGSGCTIGTTALLKEKKIIPNVVGVDIACGVFCAIFRVEGEINYKVLDDFINENIPSGHDIRKDIHPLLRKDVIDDVRNILAELRLGEESDFLKSIGSLGGGNHFLEIDVVDDNTFALFIHTGSRNLGKKVCEYFQKKALLNIEGANEIRDAMNDLIKRLKGEGREKDISNELMELKKNFVGKKTGIPKDLAYIEGEDYDSYVRNSIRCAHMAHESRRLIANDVLSFINDHFGKISILEEFDTIHNYIEQLENGDIVIRKGAISAKKGEKISIPLNMKDGVIIAIGKGNKDWNESAPHGAGRLLARARAKETLSMEEYKNQMEGIHTWSVCPETLDEAPGAYKSASSIIEQVKETCDIVAVTKPIYNFKAHSPEINWAEIKRQEKKSKNNI